jgi:hypothetical protein
MKNKKNQQCKKCEVRAEIVAINKGEIKKGLCPECRGAK